MKEYFEYVKREIPVADGSAYDKVRVGIDVVLGEAIVELVESGIDEDAHLWGSSWHDIEADDIEFALNDAPTMLKLLEHIRPTLIEKLRKVVEDIRAEKLRHSIVG